NTQSAVDKLPSLLTTPQSQMVRATGTADVRPHSVVPPVVPEGVTEGVTRGTAVHSINTKGAPADAVAPSVKPCASSTEGTGVHSSASAGTDCPGEGSNLHPIAGTWPSTMRVCQFRHPGSQTKKGIRGGGRPKG